MGSRFSSDSGNLEMNGSKMSRRLVHFTPLRYPGGKAKLAPFVKALLNENSLEDGVYIEPFAGGAGIAVQLLLQGYVSKIAINDLSRPIYAFWHSILNEADRFIELLHSVPLTVCEWDRQKWILINSDKYETFELGFATFYLNRTNRSGVLNGGIIGGRAQVGEWLIDARFNRDDLAYRIERISRHRDSIDLYNMDSIDFLNKVKLNYPLRESLVYADPPYFVKGRRLYLDYYVDEDHQNLARFLTSKMRRWKWMVSYDDVPSVRALYEGRHLSSYAIPYSVRQSQMGSEVMFYSEQLRLPFGRNGEVVGPADRFVA